MPIWHTFSIFFNFKCFRGLGGCNCNHLSFAVQIYLHEQQNEMTSKKVSKWHPHLFVSRRNCYLVGTNIIEGILQFKNDAKDWAAVLLKRYRTACCDL
jgi:hypothetical protein